MPHLSGMSLAATLSSKTDSGILTCPNQLAINVPIDLSAQRSSAGIQSRFSRRMAQHTQRSLFPGVVELLVLRLLKSQGLHGYALTQSILKQSASDPRRHLKRPDGTRDLIRTLLRTLPRNGVRPGFSIVHTAKFRAEDCTDGSRGGHYASRVTRSNWGCRNCNLLRYASEGGALVFRSRWAFARLIEQQFGCVCVHVASG
jgi:hypothetical protein